MNIGRSASVRQGQQVSSDAVEAFRAGARDALHRALGLHPWEPSPLDTVDANPPAWCATGPWAEAWRTSHDLRLRLERALAAGGVRASTARG